MSTDAVLDDAVALLCAYLAQGAPLGEDDWEAGTPGELATIGQAKEWARRLLKAAHADGLGGCLLCKG